MIIIFSVMLYNGALDLSCNHLGIIHALEANTWDGRFLLLISTLLLLLLF